MKTLFLIFSLILGLVATNHGKPINDIFSIKEPVLSEESYIHDIPFDTWEIAVSSLLDGDMVNLEEEAYVDDIPFDTRKIACKCLLRRMLERSGEANVDDIPFNTEKVICEQMLADLTEEYREERNIPDLPVKNRYIICTQENGIPTMVAVRIKMPQKALLKFKRMESIDYSLIHPVKLDIPEIRMNKNDDSDIIFIPSSSL